MLVRRLGPARGLSLSSHSVTPSHTQILLEFSNMPAERAMTPHANLQHDTCNNTGCRFHIHIQYIFFTIFTVQNTTGRLPSIDADLPCVQQFNCQLRDYPSRLRLFMASLSSVRENTRYINHIHLLPCHLQFITHKHYPAQAT